MSRAAAFAFAFAFAFALAACGGAVAPAGGGNDGGSGAPPGSGTPGTCLGAGECATTQYCDRAGTCGTGGTRGACKARPAACPEVYSPVCACDGTVYDNACLANAAGTDVGGGPSCTAKTGSFICGTTSKLCDAATSYCRRTTNDAPQPGQPTVYGECEPLPASCQNNTVCSCFPKDTPCLDFGMCREIAIPDTHSFGLEITCPGG